MDHAADTAPATPGPWKVFTSPDGFKIIGVGQSVTGEGVTDCGFGLWGGNSPEAFANARLIAAAPDLLDALINLVMDVQQYEAWARPCHNLDVANAAIAKARGIPPDP